MVGFIGGQLIHTKRSAKEKLVIAISVSYGLCVGIFAIMRFINRDWLIGLVDSIAVIFALYVGYYVYKTRQTRFASYAMATVTLLGTVVSIGIKGSTQVFWVYPSVILIYYLIPPKSAVAFSASFFLAFTFFFSDLPALTYFTTLMTFLVTVYFSYLFSVQWAEINEKLRSMATEDMLTGVGNRRALHETVDMIKSDHLSASAVMIDVDNFKKVNDLLGYQKGDKILNDTVEIIDNQVADDDLLFRLGGAKFVLICLHQDFDHAYQTAVRIRAAFNQSYLYIENGVSLSMGVAKKDAEESADGWLDQLNSAVFKAKRTGKDRIIKAINY